MRACGAALPGSPENGAREMERAVERMVASPLAQMMLKNPPSAGAVVRVAAGEGVSADDIEIRP